MAAAFFGIRGVGSLYYMAWASHEAEFPDVGWVWSTVGFTVALSVIVHGIAATPRDVAARGRADRQRR